MSDNVFRRKILGCIAGTASGFGIGAVVGSSADEHSSAPPNKQNQPEEQHDCSGTPEEPGSGAVNTHVIPEGSHRGENNFSFFLDRASLRFDLNQPDEVYSRIFVKFDKNWSQPTLQDTCKIYWAGCNLSAGPAGQGGNRPTGDNGWSVRIYTRGPDDGGTLAFGSYVYHLDQSGRYGSLWEWPDEGEIGTWIQLDTYVKLNSVTNGNANADGILRMWLNEELQDERTDVRWRSDRHLGFDRLGPGTYWGGKVGSPKHNIIYYDGFQYKAGVTGLDR